MANLKNIKLLTLDNLTEFLGKLKIFRKINIGDTSIDASDFKSELTLVGGDNITIDADTTDNKITISSTESDDVKYIYEQGYASKNLLNTKAAKSQLSIISINEDGSVTANGITDGIFNSLFIPIHLEDGDYIVNGINGGSKTTYYGRLYSLKGDVGEYIAGDDVYFTQNSSIDKENIIGLRIWFNEYKQAEYDNVTVYPMIRKASFSDPTYEPYNINNIGVTNTLLDMSNRRFYGKNLFKVTATTEGVVEVSPDGTIRATGNLSEDLTFILGKIKLEANKKYKLIGCSEGSYSLDTCYIGITDYPNIVETGHGITFTVDETKEYELYIQYFYSPDNRFLYRSFKPMIVDALLYPDASYYDFEPYVYSNLQLDENKIDKPSEASENQILTYDGSNWVAQDAPEGNIPDELADLSDDSTHRLVTDDQIADWNSKTSNVGTITEIQINGVSKGTNGVVNLPAYPTTLPASDVKEWAKANEKPTYTASEVGAIANTVTHLIGDVPTSRTINGHALTSNVLISAEDVGAVPIGTTIPEVTNTYSSTSTKAMSGKAVAEALNSIVVDNALSDTSTNAVENKAISTAINTLTQSIATLEDEYDTYFDKMSVYGTSLKIGSSTAATISGTTLSINERIGG